MRSSRAGGESLSRLWDAVVRGEMRRRCWNVTRRGSSKFRGGESLGGRVTEQQGMEGTGGWGGVVVVVGGVRRCFVVAGTPPF